jgi:Na+/H+-dicarboxylate symporter
MLRHLFSPQNILQTVIFAVLYGGIMLFLGNPVPEVARSVAVAAPVYFLLMGLWMTWRASRSGEG